ncbi:MAG: SPASM domain-containing protein [Bacteroidetes bacterium]|nr:SPASM domain-containing protein [Bacteroidota bacterium]
MSLAENWRIIRKLNFQKISNAIAVTQSYYASKRRKVPHMKGFPVSISVEPTTSCNLRCPECPSGLRQFTRPTGMLSVPFFQKMIDELHEKLIYLTFYFQGEPYLNPGFLEMVSYASNKGVYTSTSTNAHYLNDDNARKTVESKLDRIIISIDGTTQETYEQYRVGGDLQKVIEGTGNILKWKKQLRCKTPYVVFQFLVVRPNEHQINDIKRLGKELGVDEVKLKTAQVYEYEQGNDLIPINETYSRYKKEADGRYSIKNALLNQCWRMWSSCVITWDGLVVPCCFDKDATHRLGDLKQKSFAEIWHDSTYNTFRQAVLKSRQEIDICRNCSEGTEVWK